MLEPDDRSQLLETLRPPAGYTLDYAVGTTFSLDLLALLTAPLAFTSFDWEGENGRPTDDPHALLAAMKRNADRIAIFCQAGKIAVPRNAQPLYSFLEDSVFEVTPRDSSGVFHPKVWVLRYSAAGQTVRYRLLCLSRNLTFDRSWDTVLVLDGELEERKRAFARNRQLSDFVAALPKLAIRRPVSKRVLQMVNSIQKEILKVDFEMPEGVQDVRFWPLGIEGATSWPFVGRIDRMLVISPFLSNDCLNRLNEKGADNILISRPESLEPIAPQCLETFKQIFYLNPGADADTVDDTESHDPRDDAPLVGLHAKVYVADAGWDSRIWTGSANATDAAFRHNVEFLTELTGQKNQCGIDALLQKEKGGTNLMDLLELFQPGTVGVKPDLALERLKQKVQEAVDTIARHSFEARVESGSGSDEFAVTIVSTCEGEFSLPRGITVRCWPISLPPESAVAFVPVEPAARFEHMSMIALTAFFAFEVQAKAERKSERRCFVLNLPLKDAPPERRDHILRSLLSNRDEVLRLLLLLLFDDQVGGAGDSGSMNSLLGHCGGAGSSQMPLFESLMRALDHAPQRIEDVARIVDDLRKAPNCQELLPEGFDKIWEPIRQAWGKLNL